VEGVGVGEAVLGDTVLGGAEGVPVGVGPVPAVVLTVDGAAVDGSAVVGTVDGAGVDGAGVDGAGVVGEGVGAEGSGRMRSPHSVCSGKLQPLYVRSKR